MKTTAEKSSTNQQREASAQHASGRGMADRRPLSGQQQALRAAVENSPRQLAQREKMREAYGLGMQREEEPPEEEMMV